MNLYSTLQIGDYHINHCEDNLLIKKISSDKVVCAVMDGCSTAMESHFASSLFGKLLRKIIIEKGYQSLYEKNFQRSIAEELKDIIEGLFKELVLIKKHMTLDEKELLTTLTILIYDKAQDEGVILAVGDGVVCINGNITEFDHDNKPDYLAYHLHEDFENWYSAQSQKIFFNCLQDVSIATDGILSFSKIKITNSDEMVNCMEYLLKDSQYNNTEEMLNRKLKELEHQYGVKPADDLAIIRMINN
ncbi:protein phosphatase 2C domain-containing protein [Chryseobacterium aureum]|uniref:protein phosphatase 2C domain-containing protein n=1 Tax=Chryseobacterium aureum TaxID=2497456 RepID=UPI000F89AE92|nr:protein phosphatase 2C domain-containing protein [Chryseobacterium aureum]